MKEIDYTLELTHHDVAHILFILQSSSNVPLEFKRIGEIISKISKQVETQEAQYGEKRKPS